MRRVSSTPRQMLDLTSDLLNFNAPSPEMAPSGSDDVDDEENERRVHIVLSLLNFTCFAIATTFHVLGTLGYLGQGSYLYAWTVYSTFITPESYAFRVSFFLIGYQGISLIYLLCPWPISEQPARRFYSRRLALWPLVWLTRSAWVICVCHQIMWLALVFLFFTLVTLLATWYRAINTVFSDEVYYCKQPWAMSMVTNEVLENKNFLFGLVTRSQRTRYFLHYFLCIMPTSLWFGWATFLSMVNILAVAVQENILEFVTVVDVAMISAVSAIVVTSLLAIILILWKYDVAYAWMIVFGLTVIGVGDSAKSELVITSFICASIIVLLILTVVAYVSWNALGQDARLKADLQARELLIENAEAMRT